MSDEQELTSDEQALAEAVGIANAPLSAAELSEVTGLPVDVVLSAGDALISAGWFVDESRGYGPTDQAAQLDVSHARRSQLGRQIADAVKADRPGLAGRLLVAAGDTQNGFDLLASAALSANTLTEETHALAEAALEAGSALDGTAEGLGGLHMIVGRYHQSTGDSASANRSFAAAALDLEGAERIDALGFCAATADDYQRPQEAEHWLAAAEYEAVKQGEPQKYGSLLTLHARTLSRIGFPAEADRALEKGRALLVDANPIQHRLAAMNEAWILLDRGYARQAEAAFASLAFEADRSGDKVGAAFHTVYHARALFAAGKAREAEALLESVQAPTGALSFLKQLALTEGAGWFEQWDIAADRARTLIDIISEEVPQWENIGRFHLARAMLGLGEIADSRQQLAAAFDACPPGTDGWRWRLRCLALEMALSHAEGKPWDQTGAENLTDELLVARWFDIATDLMINRANIEDDKELARQAAGLASSLGNPTLAVRAAHAADMWTDSQAADIVQEAHSTAASLTEAAREQWSALPHVAAALTAEPPEADQDDSSLIDELNETLTAIGLAGSGDLLTPAQRHQSGLVRRRPTARKASRWLGIAAGIVVVIGISVGISLFLRGDPEVVTVTVTAPTTTTTTIPLTVEEIVLPPAEPRLSGAYVSGGDFARSGVADATGVRQPGGYFWKFDESASIRSAPVTYGNLVYFAQDFDIYAIDQQTKAVFWKMSTDDTVNSTPAVGQVANSEGAIGQGSTPLLVVGSDDGKVWARDATQANQDSIWQYNVGEAVRSTPVISGNLIIVTGRDGRVHGIQGADGSREWIYPAEEEDPVAIFDTSPAVANGFVYAGDSEGTMHVIHVETGELVCDFPTGAAITTSPSIVDGYVYFSDATDTIYWIPEGECPTARNVGRTNVPANFDVIAYGGHIIAASGDAQYGYDLETGQSVALNYPATSNVSTPAIVADGILYFGDQNGVLHAIDAVTLDPLWRFQTESSIRWAPAIGDGVVFVASGSALWAIGPEGP